MKVGTFCFATSRGLGHLAREFYDHGVITDPLIVLHDAVPNHVEWYAPSTPKTRIEKQDRQLFRDFVADKDAMLFFETPFDWSILEHCRRIGVRTYIVTMHECTPDPPPDRPTRWIHPSLLDVELFADHGPGVFLMLPVEYPWKLRTTARHFVHNGGYLGHHGREGTREIFEAMGYVKATDIQVTVRMQERVEDRYFDMVAGDPRFRWMKGDFPHEQLYAEGDVAVIPQKYNGCSVPIQEALASGMVVMTTNRFPTNSYVPAEPLIPKSGTIKTRIARHLMEFEEAVLDPKVIAATIDKWAGEDIGRFSETGRRAARWFSWEYLKPQWMEVLSRE